MIELKSGFPAIIQSAASDQSLNKKRKESAKSPRRRRYISGLKVTGGKPKSRKKKENILRSSKSATVSADNSSEDKIVGKTSVRITGSVGETAPPRQADTIARMPNGEGRRWKVLLQRWVWMYPEARLEEGVKNYLLQALHRKSLQ